MSLMNRFADNVTHSVVEYKALLKESLPTTIRGFVSSLEGLRGPRTPQLIYYRAKETVRNAQTTTSTHPAWAILYPTPADTPYELER